MTYHQRTRGTVKSTLLRFFAFFGLRSTVRATLVGGWPGMLFKTTDDSVRGEALIGRREIELGGFAAS